MKDANQRMRFKVPLLFEGEAQGWLGIAGLIVAIVVVAIVVLLVGQIPFLSLSQALSSIGIWNEQTISERARSLCERVLTVWQR